MRLKFNVKYSLTNEHGEFRFPAFSQKETKEVIFFPLTYFFFVSTFKKL